LQIENAGVSPEDEFCKEGGAVTTLQFAICNLRFAICNLFLLCCLVLAPGADTPNETALLVGFGEADITPALGGQPVYLAGFGQNRKAAKVHDPLMARSVVLQHGDQKIAIVSVDLVAFSFPNVERVRCELCHFQYVLISSTHNHEGPDTIGLWGPNPFQSGVDPAYLNLVKERIVGAVHQADKAKQPVTAKIAKAAAPELLHDGREPYVKHDELVVMQFQHAQTKENRGVVVQWNCHPETLDSKNTEISADFVGYTVRELQSKHKCPVVYLTGTVGGLMTSLKVPVKDDQGRWLADGTFEKTERFGRAVGQVADKALAGAKPVRLAPLQVRSREVFLPLDNKMYQLGRQLGVLKRQAYLWNGSPDKAELLEGPAEGKRLALRTEIAWLQLGELSVAAIPGEIYPELVLDKVQDPADPGADFSDAPIEPAIYSQLPGPHRMIIGLANDEIGYIIPKRQWDEKPPFCYGRQKAQYGEINSVGPETAPLLCTAFQKLVKGTGK
jgi:hypothetical protein